MMTTVLVSLQLTTTTVIKAVLLFILSENLQQLNRDQLCLGAVFSFSCYGGDSMAMSWCDHLRYQLPSVTVKYVDFLVISVVRILSVFSTLNR